MIRDRIRGSAIQICAMSIKNLSPHSIPRLFSPHLLTRTESRRTSVRLEVGQKRWSPVFRFDQPTNLRIEGPGAMGVVPGQAEAAPRPVHRSVDALPKGRGAISQALRRLRDKATQPADCSIRPKSRMCGGTLFPLHCRIDRLTGPRSRHTRSLQRAEHML
jgi:hypothetical protein